MYTLKVYFRRDGNPTKKSSFFYFSSLLDTNIFEREIFSFIDLL